MTQTSHLNTIVAIGDLHGQLDDLKRLIGRLEVLPEWPDVALTFLGDFVDRNNIGSGGRTPTKSASGWTPAAGVGLWRRAC